MNRESCFLAPLHSAPILLDCVACTLYLSLAGFASQLCDQFEQLADAGRSKRMALGF